MPAGFDKIYVKFKLRAFLHTHPLVTDPVGPDPVGYFHLPSEKLVSPVPSEYFDFTLLFLYSPVTVR